MPREVCCRGGANLKGLCCPEMKGPWRSETLSGRWPTRRALRNFDACWLSHTEGPILCRVFGWWRLAARCCLCWPSGSLSPAWFGSAFWLTLSAHWTFASEPRSCPCTSVQLIALDGSAGPGHFSPPLWPPILLQVLPARTRTILSRTYNSFVVFFHSPDRIPATASHIT